MFARTNHLRARGHGHNRVTSVELFFDLVFVFAVTQLSHGLLAHLTPLGALQTAVLMLAVWWAWIDNIWLTNWADPEHAPVRILLFVLMLLGLVISASIPKAFDAGGIAFGLTYGICQILPKPFMLWLLKRHDAGNYRNYQRITVWRAAGAVCWIAGGFCDPQTRLAVWLLALAIDNAAPILGFPVPGLGRSTTTDWVVEGGHMAERFAGFVIIALGESVLVTGATFAEMSWTPGVVAALINGFAGSVAMWLVYFNIGAERTSRVFAASEDPGRLARSGYTYFHIPIVAGIIVAAVGDELVLHHPGGHTGVAAAAVILGGPALYLAGNAAFKRLTAPYWPLSHLVGLALLAALVLAVPFASPLALSAASTAVLLVVAVWEWLSLVARAGRPPIGH